MKIISGVVTNYNQDSDGVNGMKTIYSDKTHITRLSKNNFSHAEYVLNSRKGVWTGLYYYDGYLYAGASNTIKRVRVFY